MPTYEYVCSKCGHEFEKFQSMKDTAIEVCPKEICAQKRWGRGKVKRMMGAGAGLIFKGSGFYITDYRSENYKQGAKKESSGGESKTATPAASTTPATTGSTEKKAAAPAKTSTKSAKAS